MSSLPFELYGAFKRAIMMLEYQYLVNIIRTVSFMFPNNKTKQVFYCFPNNKIRRGLDLVIISKRSYNQPIISGKIKMGDISIIYVRHFSQIRTHNKCELANANAHFSPVIIGAYG